MNERTYHRRRSKAALGPIDPAECELIMTAPAIQAANPKLFRSCSRPARSFID